LFQFRGSNLFGMPYWYLTVRYWCQFVSQLLFNMVNLKFYFDLLRCFFLWASKCNRLKLLNLGIAHILKPVSTYAVNYVNLSKTNRLLIGASLGLLFTSKKSIKNSYFAQRINTSVAIDMRINIFIFVYDLTPPVQLISQ
jgi:hypothetical protein